MKKIIWLMAASLMLFSCAGGTGSGEDNEKSEEENTSGKLKEDMLVVDKLELVAEFGPVTPADVTVTGWVQGLVVYDGRAAILHDGGQVIIYDIAKKEYLSSYDLPDNKSHCNNAALGLQKYSSSSIFPLVYVSDCVDKGDCYVYDLKLNSAKEVQRIKLAEKPGGENGGNGWFIDEKNNKLGMHWNDKYYFFDIPDVYQAEALVSVNSVQASGKMNLPSTHQGACAWNGYIFFPNGFADDPYLTVVNIETKEHFNIDLLELGVKNEPEGICEYNGSIYFSCCKSAREALLYKLDLTFVR